MGWPTAKILAGVIGNGTSDDAFGARGVRRPSGSRVFTLTDMHPIPPGAVYNVIGGSAVPPPGGTIPTELSFPADIAWKLAVLDVRVGVEPVLQGGGPARYPLKPITMLNGMEFSVTVKNLSGQPVLFSAQVKSVDKSSPKPVFSGWPKAQR